MRAVTLVLPWPVEPGRNRRRFRPRRCANAPNLYRLLVELARGKLNQVRTQTADWQSIGLQTTAEFDRALHEATQLFGRAALADIPAEADAHASLVLEKTHDSCGPARPRLHRTNARDPARRRRATRHLAHRTSPSGPLGGEAAKEYTSAPSMRRTSASAGATWNRNSAQYDWTQADAAVSAALDAGLPVAIGPIIDLAPGMLPAWAAGWQSDLPGTRRVHVRLPRNHGEPVQERGSPLDYLCRLQQQRRSGPWWMTTGLRLAFRLFEAAAS